jgi:phospholipid/cholesterol/gamma-HCH transport system ATP-binding protein
MPPALVRLEQVVTRFGAAVVHDGVSLEIDAGQVVALIGGSGTGKSVLLREMVGLQRPSAGRVWLFGEDLAQDGEERLAPLRRRFGMLFQDGALFSSISVGDNVAVPFREHTPFDARLVDALVGLKLSLVGLGRDALGKMPAELSGGMRKRVSLARALALEPEILFLDEPTSGLDPIGARAFDRLLRTLADSLALTVVMVTHDLDTLWSIADRAIALHAGKIIADGPVDELAHSSHPWLVEYFAARANHPPGEP